MLQLVIGNKNYSSWSMRPWVLMRQFDIAFDEVMLRFDSMDAGSEFKRRVAAVSPASPARRFKERTYSPVSSRSRRRRASLSAM